MKKKRDNTLISSLKFKYIYIIDNLFLFVDFSFVVYCFSLRFNFFLHIFFCFSSSYVLLHMQPETIKSIIIVDVHFV